MKYTLLTLIAFLLLASCASKQEQSYRSPPDISAMSEEAAEPLAITNPRYPYHAAMNGIEGWVFLEFDLDQNGHPMNLSVLDSSPGDVFVKGASDAIVKWTFRKNNTQNRSQYLMQFRLED